MKTSDFKRKWKEIGMKEGISFTNNGSDMKAYYRDLTGKKTDASFFYERREINNKETGAVEQLIEVNGIYNNHNSKGSLFLFSVLEDYAKESACRVLVVSQSKRNNHPSNKIEEMKDQGILQTADIDNRYLIDFQEIRRIKAVHSRLIDCLAEKQKQYCVIQYQKHAMLGMSKIFACMIQLFSTSLPLTLSKIEDKLVVELNNQRIDTGDQMEQTIGDILDDWYKKSRLQMVLKGETPFLQEFIQKLSLHPDDNEEKRRKIISFLGKAHIGFEEFETMLAAQKDKPLKSFRIFEKRYAAHYIEEAWYLPFGDKLFVLCIQDGDTLDISAYPDKESMKEHCRTVCKKMVSEKMTQEINNL